MKLFCGKPIIADGGHVCSGWQGHLYTEILLSLVILLVLIIISLHFDRHFEIMMSLSVSLNDIEITNLPSNIYVKDKIVAEKSLHRGMFSLLV